MLSRADMHIRKATNTDIPAIIEISRTTSWDKSDYLRQQTSNNCVDVATFSATVMAFIAWNREFFSKTFIWLCVVAPQFRGIGVGSNLFEMVERQCNASRLYTSTNRSNEAMQRFLDHRGYRFAGEVDLEPGDPEAFYCIDL